MAATMLARLGASLSLILSGSSSGRMLKAGVLIGFGFYLHGLLVCSSVAGIDLALSRQPFAPRPVCWSALGFTALGMLLVDPAVAFASGWLVETSHLPALSNLTHARTGA
jgi:hypothetical protein